MLVKRRKAGLRFSLTRTEPKSTAISQHQSLGKTFKSSDYLDERVETSQKSLRVQLWALET